MSLCHLDDVVGTPLSETCNGILTIIFGGPATPEQVQIGGWTPLQISHYCRSEGRQLQLVCGIHA